MLERGRPLDEQNAAGARRRLHEHASSVVLGDELAGNEGRLDSVDGRCALAGRNLKDLAHGRPLGGGSHALDVDGTAILEQAKLDRRVPEAVAHGRHRQIYARIVQDRLRDGDAEDLAVLARHR